MKIGVICEGPTDRAVIGNILKGLKNVDSAQIIPLRPKYSKDETDLADIQTDTFGGWNSVKEECESRIKIRDFLDFEGNDIVIIHIDSAESDEYGVSHPIKDANFSITLRARIIAKINEWLEGEFQDKIIYAVAIEETEAWILTIYEKKDSSKSAKPKEKLRRVLSNLGIKYSQTPEDFKSISDKFTRKKNFLTNKYLSYNKSLEDFCNEVNSKL